VTQICPVPLPLWMADSAGKGIMITAICHGLAQLEGRWDTHGAQAIWDTAGVKIILGGVTDADTLEDISRLCGEIDLRVHSHTIDDYGRRARTWTYQTARVLPPELLRMLPERRALVVRGNLSPVIIRLRMAWRRHDYRRARRTTLLPQLSLALAQLPGSRAAWAAEPGDYRALPPADQTWSYPADQEPEEFTAPDEEPHDAPPPDGDQPQDWATPDDDRTDRPRRPWQPRDDEAD
jgi:type IV secretory pathway TraG/TraD family ATPase VirD4